MPQFFQAKRRKKKKRQVSSIEACLCILHSTKCFVNVVRDEWKTRLNEEIKSKAKKQQLEIFVKCKDFGVYVNLRFKAVYHLSWCGEVRLCQAKFKVDDNQKPSKYIDPQSNSVMQWFWWLFDAIADLIRLCNDSDHQVQVSN